MKLRSPLMENCCCCVSNKTGTLVFAYLSLIGYIFLFLAALGDMGSGVGMFYMNKDEPPVQGLADGIIFAGVPTVFISILGIIFSSMLINGIHKKMSCIMIPWLTLQISGAAYTLGIIISVLLINVLLMSAIAVPLLIVLLALEIYCIMVVFSTYQEINMEAVPHIPLDFEAN